MQHADGKRKVEAYFDDAARVGVFTGVQWTDDGETYLNRAISARESAEAQANTEDEQAGLNSDSWETSTSEIAEEQAVRSVLEKIEEDTEEKGDHVHVPDVVASLPHTEERSRNIIENLIHQRVLFREGDDHVSLVDPR